MYRFDAQVWLWKARESWHFLTVPDDVSDDIDARNAHNERGFGSVRVRVTIGSTSWSTSVFPDRNRAAYVLPLKKAVRTAEGLDVGTTATVVLELVDDPPTARSTG